MAARRTLRLEFVVSALHDAQVRVTREHFRPLGHALEDLGLDLLVCIAVVGQTQQGVGEAPRCELLVHFDTAVLAEGVGELERVELDVGIAVREPLDHGRDGLLRACVGRADFVAYIL